MTITAVKNRNAPPEFQYYAFFGDDLDLDLNLGQGPTAEAAVRDLIDNYDWPKE